MNPLRHIKPLNWLVFDAIVLFAAFMLIGGCIPAHAKPTNRISEAMLKAITPPAYNPVHIRELHDGHYLVICTANGLLQDSYDGRGWNDLIVVTNRFFKMECNGDRPTYRLLEPPVVRSRQPKPEHIDNRSVYAEGSFFLGDAAGTTTNGGKTFEPVRPGKNK